MRPNTLLILAAICGLLLAACSTPSLADEASLAAAVRQAADQWPDDPEALLEAQRRKALAAVQRFERQLAPGPAGQAWRTYLRLPELKTQLQTTALADFDHDLLAFVITRLTAGREGLEWARLVPLRNALNALQGRLRALGPEDAQQRWNDSLIALAEALESDDLAQQQRAIHRGLSLIQQSGQQPKLAQSLAEQYTHPNGSLVVDRRLLLPALGRAVDETGPVRETILGRLVQGTRRTQGDVDLLFLPSDNQLRAAFVFNGSTRANTVTRERRVRIFGRNLMGFSASNSIAFDGQRFTSEPAQGGTRMLDRSSRISVEGHLLNRLITRLAERQLNQRRGEAEAEATMKARRRLNREMDQQTTERMAELQTRYDTRYRLPLARMGIATNADTMRLSSTSQRWTIATRYTLGPQAAAPTPPPPVERAAVALRLHETTPTNLGQTLAGRYFTDSDLQQTFIDAFGRLPEDYEPDPEPGSIRFALDNPLEVRIGDGTILAVVRMDQFVRGDREFDDWTMLVEYSLDPADGGIRFTRKELRFFPHGKGPDDRLSLPEQFRAGTLKKAFERTLPEDLTTTGIDLAEFWNRPGRLEIRHVSCENGWLSLDWEIAQSLPQP